MTDQRKREIAFLRRLRQACVWATRTSGHEQPQLGDVGLSTSAREWEATFNALQDARYYDAPATRRVRCVDSAIRALTKGGK